jgi:hypothetical protein
MDQAVYDPVIAIPECECGLNYKEKILVDLTDEGTLIKINHLQAGKPCRKKGYRLFLAVDCFRVKNLLPDNGTVKCPVKTGFISRVACSTGLHHFIDQAVPIAVR